MIRQVQSLCVLFVLVCLATEALGQAPSGPTQTRLQYPPTRRDSTAEVHHGVRVADPYRWLEDLTSPETKAWVENQQTFTDSVLRGVPQRDAILSRLRHLRNPVRPDVEPIVLGGRLYLLRKEEGKRLRVTYTTADGRTPGTVLLDPNSIRLQGTDMFRAASPSPDHRYVSYYVSPSGRDYGELRIRSVVAGRDLPDTLRGMRHPGTVWLGDRGLLLYTRNDAADTGGVQATSTGRQLVLHRVGTGQSQDRVLYEAREPGAWVRPHAASSDGQFAVITEEGRVLVVDALRVDTGAVSVREVLGRGVHTPLGFVGHTLFVRSQLDAPNGRIVAIDVSKGSAARVVVPEGSEPIVDAVLTSERLVVQVMRDVVSRVLLYALDGRPAGEVPLPGPGNVRSMLASPRSTDLYLDFTSPLTPGVLYHHSSGSASLRRIGGNPVEIDASSLETRQHFFTSKDGTRVPLFLTMRRDAPRDGTVPIILHAYGGFGNSSKPSYLPWVMTWLEMGGAHVVANVRGGGEYGAAWHQAGMRAQKQTVFDDVIAAAEFLVRERYTSAQRLVLYGESNGGMTMGAVLTQRPDLFAVALPLSGVHDMLRFHLFTVGRNWAGETGTAEDAEMFPYIRAYSPLHNVRPGTCYPATLVMAAADDDRVVPSHSYKFAAALQSAQSCARPVLLHVARGASHMSDTGEGQLRQTADMLAFAANQVGLRLPPAFRSSAASGSGAPRTRP
jgi:prolyl oligopeptidase